MAARGYGRIIGISSQQAHRPFAASGAYGVSKAGLEALNAPSRMSSDVV